MRVDARKTEYYCIDAPNIHLYFTVAILFELELSVVKK